MAHGNGESKKPSSGSLSMKNRRKLQRAQSCPISRLFAGWYGPENELE